MRINFFAAMVLSVAAMFVSVSDAKATGRVMYSTIVQNTLGGTGTFTWGLGGSTVATVTLKNISNQTQTVTATIADQHILLQAFFDTEPKGASDLPSWTENPSYTTVRYKAKDLPPISTTITIGPMASGTIGFDIFCVTDDPETCYSGTDPVGLPGSNDVHNISFQSQFSIQVSIAEDRGAVLADLNIAMRVFLSPGIPEVDSTRSLNGGRPF